MTALPEWPEIERTLTTEGASVAERYRALFSSRQRAPSPEQHLECVRQFLSVERTVLLRHEAAYVLGQMASVAAVPFLRSLLDDGSEDPVTRHEAAEALAAIATADHAGAELRAEIEQHLSRYVGADAGVMLEHTCLLALEGLRRVGDPDALPPCVCATVDKDASEAGMQYTSRDPARGLRGRSEADVAELGALLGDEGAGLYPRYEAMFTLRNLGGDGAVAELCKVLAADRSSEVLRHEIAFVLGQMEHPASTAALITKLGDLSEADVVRHEAAIALGAVGTDEAEAALLAAAHDPSQFVADSCEAALASLRYWREWDELEQRLRDQ
eukprot:TRINITY_DN16508_c0_g1_i1.p1 TRINITY_DN16508_c0_g1~~TRINITY_DN16508_c0_g1_i1.p1  ORF type:complete len:345 (+),score=140.25 TRINITY_DN16508_c0_g1_i1:53-1036(+)